MTTYLKVAPVVKVVLTANYPKSNLPQRFGGLVVGGPVKVKLKGTPVTITLSGTVKNGSGVGLQYRNVRVFSDQGMTQMLGATQTNSSGAWSISGLPGTSSTPFVVVAQGEAGENAQIFVNV